MSKWLAALAALVAATGCNFGNAAQTCTSDQQCQSAAKPGGRCELGAQLCSFLDPGCDSGRRFGGLAGDQSDQCVGGGSGPVPVVDAAIDARPVPPADAVFCYGTGIVKICLAAAPTTPFTTSGGTTTIDTTTSSLCARVVSGGNNFCVIAATTINIAGTLVGIGTKPLVLLATQSITTSAPIDVASHRIGIESIGAGADFSECAAGTLPFNGAGGAGGSFAGTGGTGGLGAVVGTSTGGVAGDPITGITALRGGCPGQDGEGSNRGLRGHGGGAAYLIAGTSIMIGAAINAAGEGGAGGLANISGGGGGGSGGMIGFDAPVINVTRLLLASGGGGGEGSREGTFSSAGGSGADPNSFSPAPGGDVVQFGGAGGSGSEANTDGAGGDGVSGTVGGAGANRGAGGGGGGGAGVIIAPVTAVFQNATTPAVTTQ